MLTTDNNTQISTNPEPAVIPGYPEFLVCVTVEDSWRLLLHLHIGPVTYPWPCVAIVTQLYGIADNVQCFGTERDFDVSTGTDGEREVVEGGVEVKTHDVRHTLECVLKCWNERKITEKSLIYTEINYYFAKKKVVKEFIYCPYFVPIGWTFG